MSNPDVQVPDEGTAEEVENLPAPSDPESPAFEPEDPEADDDGPSDDDATGADDADDASEPDEPRTVPPPTPPPPDSASRLEDVTRDLAKAARTYGNKVAATFADDWMGCIPCPLCADDFPGILTPAPRSDEVIATVRPIIGLPDLSTFREDRYARECERCAGLGKTLTGSRVPAYATMLCPECKGAGFKSAEQGAPAASLGNGSDVPPPPTHVDEEAPYQLPPEAQDALEKMLNASRNAGVAG